MTCRGLLLGGRGAGDGMSMSASVTGCEVCAKGRRSTDVVFHSGRIVCGSPLLFFCSKTLPVKDMVYTGR